MTLQARLDSRLRRLALPPGPVLVAVSGGPDSLALLDLLSHGGPAAQLSLHVAHLDHGIHPDSARLLESVRRIADRYGLPFVGARIELGPDASETEARIARYEWLESEASRLGASAIFTAHQRDDQIETVLMRVLRGSGSAGLAGMAFRRGRIVRPLLGVARSDLECHARGLGIPVWDDPSNLDLRHERVWIRRVLLPLLRERHPALDRQILRLARKAAGERAGWDGLLEDEVALDLRGECDGISVAASPLRDYDSTVVRALLGALGRRVGCHVGPMRAARIEHLLAGGRSGATAQLGSGCAAELTFDRLRLFREGVRPWDPFSIADQHGSVRAGNWELSWRPERAPSRTERMSFASWLSPGAYRVRPWRPGDRIHPLGGTGRRLVVRCMQEARIARHVRAAWPVLETGGTIVWVPGVCRSADALPAPETPAVRIDAHQR